MHRQDVSHAGVVNQNTVVYSVTLGTDTGDFRFNWIGLVNKARNLPAMIVHAPDQQKIKNAAGQQGNVLTRSFLMEYSGAAAQTQINVAAESWQIDFSARLAAVDERQRHENADIYGAAAFFDDGWLVTREEGGYRLTAGTGYVAGLRVVLGQSQGITVTGTPVTVWLDACFQGTVTSVWQVETAARLTDSLSDYDAEDGRRHYVAALARINEDGSVSGLRPRGSLAEQSAQARLTAHEQSRNHPDATTDAKGFTQLSSATDSDSETMAATPKAVKAAYDLARGSVKSVNQKLADGSGDVALSYRDVSALGADDTAVAAAKLATARKIAGVTFDGTEDIAITAAGVGAFPAEGGTVGNQGIDTSGTIKEQGYRVYSPLNRPPAASENTASKTTNGWWKCGDTGLIIQWGYSSFYYYPGYCSVTFPIKFPHDYFSISNTVIRPNGWTAGAGNWSSVREPTKTGFESGSDRAGTFWMAIGY